MGKRIFTADLSVKGIEELKKQLLEYRDNELPRKCRLLVEKLTDIGMGVANAKIGESPLGKHVTLQSTISEEKAGCKAMIIAVGDVKEVEGREPFNLLLAIEFGSGIFHNPTANPNSDEFGLGVGSYPGQVNAFKDGWVYWDDDKQEWRYTHGVKATMPMYEAQKAIKDRIGEAVKEVFG